MNNLFIEKKRKRLIMIEIKHCTKFYNGLIIKEENNKYYWCIEHHTGYYWDEIPKYLYDTLLKYFKNINYI